MSKPLIGIMYGGNSVEHDISIITALQVMENINLDKWDILPIYITKSNEFKTDKRLLNLAFYKQVNFNQIINKMPNFYFLKHHGMTYFSNSIKKCKNGKKIDLIFNCTHGEGVEDGTITALCNWHHLPHTAAPLFASALAQDKDQTKKLLRALKINVLESITLYKDQKNDDFKLSNIKLPAIVKPAHLGSSIGIQKVDQEKDLKDAISNAFLYDDKIIIERFIENKKEYSVACFKLNEKIIVSNVEEIETLNAVFNFDEKYINHHKDANHHLIKNDDVAQLALKMYQELDFKGIVRFDFLEENGIIYLNEINTIPGALSNYLFDITFTTLIDQVIHEALLVFQKQEELVKVFNSTVLTNTRSLTKK